MAGRHLLVVTVLAAGSLPGQLLAQNWKDSLKVQLLASIVPSSTTGDRLHITKPGTVLEVERDGISATPGGDDTYLKNYFRDGRIEQAGGLAARLVNNKDSRDMRIGEKVYVTDINVNDNDIQLRLVSLETSQIVVDGNTQQTRYKAVVQFDVGKDSVRVVGFRRLRDLVNTVLGSGEPKSIEIGQTVTQVETTMGRPESILKVGTKTIYVYKAIKVTFVDGKVTDLQ